MRAELPAVGELGERGEKVLVSAWLTGLRSARTRRAYAADVAAWLRWLARRETGTLAAGRVHVDLWAVTQLDTDAAASTARRRLSALSSLYRYCAAHDLIGRVPTQGVARPVVDPDYTATVGLDRDQARALAAADADTGAPGAAHHGGGAAAAAQRERHESTSTLPTGTRSTLPR